MKPGLLGWLSRTPVLIGLFIVTFLIAASFYFVIDAIEGDMLDMIWSGEDAIARLNELSARQKQAHFLGTVTLDVLFPFAYGALFIGLLCRLAWRWRWALILLPITVALCDLAENTVQAMALNGYPKEILLFKDIVTPIKGGGFMIALALVVLLAIVALVRRLRSPTAE